METVIKKKTDVKVRLWEIKIKLSNWEKQFLLLLGAIYDV